MEIDDEIVILFPQFHRVSEDAEQAVVLPFFINKETGIDMPILPHDIGEQLVREQRNTRGGIVVPERPQDGRHKHEIAEVHEVDDENIPIQTCDPSSASLYFV